MAIRDVLPQLRKDRNLTQEELAAKLFVTRQAVSRWETGETTPGIDMTKLLAVTLDVPITLLLEMPDHICESCGMILEDPSQYGTESNGTSSRDYCKWCYDKGSYTYETSMEAMIEDCAPRMAEQSDFTLDEAVSLMGAVLPFLTRWQDDKESAR